MVKYRSYHEYPSRLKRQESKRFAYQALLFLGLGIITLWLIYSYSLPLLTKFALVIGDLKSSSLPVGSKDTLPPLAPKAYLPFTATNSANLNLVGFAEPDSLVVLYANGSKQAEALTNPAGEFSIEAISLFEGQNQLHFTAKDNAGNLSPQSETLTITVFTLPPSLEITSPLDGDRFYGLMQQNLTLTGRLEPKNSLTVNDHHVVVSSNGEFKYKTQLAEGDNHFTLTASDPAGNTTSQELTVFFAF